MRQNYSPPTHNHLYLLTHRANERKAESIPALQNAVGVGLWQSLRLHSLILGVEVIHQRCQFRHFHLITLCVLCL